MSGPDNLRTPTHALSILQPWAWLIVHGHKAVENRNWKPWNHGLKMRGPIWVHAGKGFDADGVDFALDMGIDLPQDSERYDRGGIVGRAVITDVVTRHPSPWFFGPYGLVLAKPEPVAFKPCRGQLGFFVPNFDAPAPEPAKDAPRQPASASRQGALEL
ncbi:MAG: ASCH domain-containing protein [Alphaproteobacteria bacterium]|jgi:hypothetical protein|nr:ASCH domain-containing protein [Alphaproteobacteria bacterium]